MKDKILRLLKSSDDYISGEEISRKLGVTRAAVWKVISKLKEEGYQFDSVTNRGYRLKFSPDILTSAEITPYLTTEKIGRKIYFYSVTDSTNQCARIESENGAPDGSLFIAEEQTAGRGRLGKSWNSAPGTGIWMSLLLRPDVRPEEITQITLLAGLSVCHAINDITGLTVKIKWPNDIVIHGKKICGILTEMSAEVDQINCLICGIGVNVNIEKFPNEIKDIATSIAIENGKKLPRAKIAAEIMNYFEKDYFRFINEGVTENFLKEYKDNCITINKKIKAIQNGKEIFGTAIDITKKGELVIQTETEQMVLSSGEVSVRGLLGYV